MRLHANGLAAFPAAAGDERPPRRRTREPGRRRAGARRGRGKIEGNIRTSTGPAAAVIRHA